MKNINRRKFFTGVGSGLITLGVSRHLKGSANIPQTDPKNTAETSEPRIKKYNTIGKTGIKTSDIIFGATSFFSASVAKYAYDLGVTVFDTAENYMGGRAEEMFGQALKGLRDKVSIITKHYGNRAPATPVNKQQLFERFNASLKRLQTDYIDFAFIHSLDDEADVNRFLQNDDLMSGYAQLKKEGKVRFTGFSTHNAKFFLEQALKPEFAEFAQVIMFMYNHMEGKEIEPVIKQIRDKGIGTIAMKTLAGGQQGNLKTFMNQETSYPQAAIAWVLGNPNIDCAVVSMRSFSHVEEYVSASGRALKREDLALLKEYSRQVDNTYCRVTCKKCEPSCPHHVAISDVMRFEMYFKNYGHEKTAIENYALLDDARKPKNCSNCSGHCNIACPFGIKVQDRLIHADEILHV